MEEHYYNAANTKLRDLGLEPHYLGAELVQSMLQDDRAYKDRVIQRAIMPRTRWKPGELEAARLRLARLSARPATRPLATLVSEVVQHLAPALRGIVPFEYGTDAR